MALWGMTKEDFKDEENVEVWGCNLPSVNLFISIMNQWRRDSGYPFALDYNVLYTKIDRTGAKGAEADRLESDVRVMEDAALEQMRKDRD